MATRGDTLFLLGRDVEDLRRSADDLVARGAAGTVGVACCDLERPDTFEPALTAAETAMGRLDAVVVTAGLFATQDRLEADPVLTERLLTVNFTHTVVFCERVRERLLAGGGGTLCVFSSVAGERGRKPVVLYGAAKAGLSRYLEGVDHKFRSRGVIVVCVKPGVDDRGVASAPVCCIAGVRGGSCAEGHRPGPTSCLCAPDLAPHPARDQAAAQNGDAEARDIAAASAPHGLTRSNTEALIC
jgi:NAD(P)-dependent dehydrogenase (short-subunit alcohol dehydrogenase family)